MGVLFRKAEVMMTGISILVCAQKTLFVRPRNRFKSFSMPAKKQKTLTTILRSIN